MAPTEQGGILSLLTLLNPIGTAQAQELPPEEESRPTEAAEREPGETLKVQRYMEGWRSLKAIDPTNRTLETMEPPGYVPTEADVERIETAARDASIARTCDSLRPDGKPIGQPGSSARTRLMSGGLAAAQQDYDYLSIGGMSVPFPKGSMVRLPYGAGTVTLRSVTSTPGSPAVDVKIPNVIQRKLHY